MNLCKGDFEVVCGFKRSRGVCVGDILHHSPNIIELDICTGEGHSYSDLHVTGGWLFNMCYIYEETR